MTDPFYVKIDTPYFMVAILNNIRSSYNVGSIFRTADAAGVEKIYLCGITPGPRDKYGRINQKLAKVALGAELSVPHEYCKSAAALIKKLKKEGYKILALEQHKRSMNIFTQLVDFRSPQAKKCVLILGGEIKGLPASILKNADKILEIPQKGKKESLNVSVAFGIAIFQLIR